MKKIHIPSLVWAIVATALAVAIVWFVDHEVVRRHNDEQRALVVDKVGGIRSRLEAALNSRLALVEGMAAFVKSSKETGAARSARFAELFTAYTDEILKNVGGIRSLQLAPRGVVTYINPLTGNEAALGHDLMADQARREAAGRAVREESLIVAGPVELRQGGVALIGRLPIFLPVPGEGKWERFWGFSIILIDLPPLLKEAGLREQASGMNFALRGKDGLGAQGAVFFGDGAIFAGDPVIQKVTLPNGSWQLAASPVAGWGQAVGNRFALRAFGGAMSVAVGALLFVLLSGREKLATSEKRYRGLIESSDLGIHISKPDGERLFINTALTRLLGYGSSEEIFELPLFGLIAPHEVEIANRRRREACENPSKLMQYECDFLRKDGSIIPLHVIINTIVWDGEEAIQRTLIDLSERKKAEQALFESEEKLRKAFEGTGIGMLIRNRKDRTVFCNNALRKMFGYSQEELEAMHMNNITHPDDREENERLHRKLVAGEIDGFEIRKRYIRKDGEPIWVLNDLSTIRDDQGDVLFTINLYHDLTETRNAEDQLRQAQKMEAVGQLTGGVAHDFNNLLTVVLGNLELLLDRVSDDEIGRGYVDSAISGAQRGAELTHRLLAFSRRQALVPVILDPRELVDGLFEMLRRTLGETIEIDISGGGDLWCCAADPAQLESAILNLAINARDAMPNGGKLSIAAENVILADDDFATQADLTPGRYVMIVVTDTGTGIPAEDIDRVFEPFFTTKEVGSGSGLGLSMVYGFAKQSGGHAAIRSDDGDGTTVKIYLPASVTMADEAAPEEPGTEPRARGETILVVEDDPDVRVLTVALLSDLGYGIVEAADGASALTAFEGAPGIDLLFTDVVLSGDMSGPDLATEIVRRCPGISVLFTSGYADDAVIHQDQIDAGYELLNKPFRKNILARMVRSTLDRANM